MQDTLDIQTRPWGNYKVLFEGNNFKVKRLEINPQSRFSLQRHRERAEKWIVVSGTGIATLGEKEIPVERESVLEIPLGEIHRLYNRGQEPLVVIEVQFGNFLGEEDVVRLEDDFRRL